MDARDKAKKGRGSVSNREGRFETYAVTPFDDGWGSLDAEPAPPLKTRVFEDRARSIISTNQSPDIPFDQSINPYRGCEHGCIYCYARPTHAYLGYSPGLDFESVLFAKNDAAALLEQALRKRAYVPKCITIGANTDAYQPLERERRITRSILEVLAAFNHPTALITKSALVLRDLDLLAPMAAKGLVHVFVSITTLEPALARIMEPRAAAPHRRLQTLRDLAAAGVPTSVNAAPMIPAINDMELDKILEASAAAGAHSASYILVRLPLELKDLFEEWLATHFPDRAAHVMSLIRQTRGGEAYQAGFGSRMRGTGPYAELLRKRFRVARKRFGLDRPVTELRTDLFKPPLRPGDQIPLFD